MTPRQKEVFIVIDEWWTKFGYSPSIDDVMYVLGVKGRGNIHRIINDLVKLGALKKVAGKRRTVRPLRINFKNLQ
jgi:SOS-response transcriptional repressor LexA